MNAHISQPKILTFIQGDYIVSDDSSHILSTVLGSCVAACLNDPVAKIGGMNHFLLPDGRDESGSQVKYGAYAMELLINEVMKLGGSRKNMVAKLFGGANITPALGDIGQKNINFAKNFLQVEGIPCVSESVGGNQARRIQYWPTTGAAKQRLVPRQLLNEEEVRKPKPVAPPSTVLF
jgi:chemotaxis protein CheD